MTFPVAGLCGYWPHGPNSRCMRSSSGHTSARWRSNPHRRAAFRRKASQPCPPNDLLPEGTGTPVLHGLEMSFQHFVRSITCCRRRSVVWPQCLCLCIKQNRLKYFDFLRCANHLQSPPSLVHCVHHWKSDRPILQQPSTSIAGSNWIFSLII